MGYEDIIAELNATKEVIVEAQKAVSARKESQDSFSSNIKNLLEQTKNNPEKLNNIPHENIQNHEGYLEGLNRLNGSGAIQAGEEIKDLEEFLALYNETKKKEQVSSCSQGFNKNYDYVIKILKEAYGDEIEGFFDYCTRVTKHDDEIISKTQFLILAVKFYPTNLGYYSRDEIEWLSEYLKKQNKTDNDALVHTQINKLDEFIRLEHRTFTHSFDKEKRRVDYTDPNNILHEGGFVAKLSEGKASIIDYLGTNETIIIPVTVNEVLVDSIGDRAFCGKKIKQAVIPSCIKKIGENAFDGCNLTTVNLPDGLSSIGKYAFSCNKLKEIFIPSSVTFIGEKAFQSNEIISANIPSGVARISDMLFECNKLTSVEIAEGVTSIKHGAFRYNCLETVTIPESVTSISSSVFNSNPLKMIILPANIKFDYFSCAEGDLTEAYSRNSKSAGVYKYNDGHWSFFLDADKFSDWDIQIHNEMEKLAINQEKAIEKIKMSNDGRKLSSLQSYFRNPIPKQIWDAMPDGFKAYVRKEITGGKSGVSYTPAPTEKMLGEIPLLRILNSNCERITVSHGVLASRTYNARTGECVVMS